MDKITFIDKQGRFRIVSPAYGSWPHGGKTPAELLELVISEPVKGILDRYGVDRADLHIVDGDALKACCEGECCGNRFRYPPGQRPEDRDALGNVKAEVIARYAWTMGGDGMPVVDMPLARGIQMDYIREVRNKELAAKDITFMRAVEAGDTDAQATIATEKQTLRDIPQTFDLTTDTPTQLKAKWPSELPARE